jgi:hypothetical protein
MTAADVEYELYRCTVHGGSKDWAIAIMANGHVRTLHCATGATVKQTNIPPSKFGVVGGRAADEMDRRIQEKLRKGYEPLGSAIIDENRLELKRPNASQPATLADHWEILKPLEPRKLNEVLSWIVDQLRDHAAPNVIEYDKDAVVLRIGTRTGNGAQWWVFGFSEAGGIQPTGRGGGQILRKHGLLPRLILLHLLKSFPDSLQLSDGAEGLRQPRISRDDKFVGERLFDYERVLDLGGRLGLCIGRISLVDVEAGENRAFWI